MSFSLFMAVTDRLQPTKGTAGVCRILCLTEQEELRLRLGPQQGFCSRTCQAEIGLSLEPSAGAQRGLRDQWAYPALAHLRSPLRWILHASELRLFSIMKGEREKKYEDNNK